MCAHVHIWWNTWYEEFSKNLLIAKFLQLLQKTFSNYCGCPWLRKNSPELIAKKNRPHYNTYCNLLPINCNALILLSCGGRPQLITYRKSIGGRLKTIQGRISPINGYKSIYIFGTTPADTRTVGAGLISWLAHHTRSCLIQSVRNGFKSIYNDDTLFA